MCVEQPFQISFIKYYCLFKDHVWVMALSAGWVMAECWLSAGWVLAECWLSLSTYWLWVLALSAGSECWLSAGWVLAECWLWVLALSVGSECWLSAGWVLTEGCLSNYLFSFIFDWSGLVLTFFIIIAKSRLSLA